MQVLKPGITLYLIRHGETDWNREARYQGQRDIPLNDTGRSQARRHGRVLEGLKPSVADFDFVSSPLQRAIETMALLRRELGLDAEDFRQDQQIAELNYGHWEGQLASDLPHFDPVGLADKAQDPFRWRPQGGESYCDLQDRIAAWLRTLERDTVAVTHGGVSRVARGAILNLAPDAIPFLAVPQDQILVLRDGAAAWI